MNIIQAEHLELLIWEFDYAFYSQQHKGFRSVGRQTYIALANVSLLSRFALMLLFNAFRFSGSCLRHAESLVGSFHEHILLLLVTKLCFRMWQSRIRKPVPTNNKIVRDLKGEAMSVDSKRDWKERMTFFTYVYSCILDVNYLLYN